MNIAGKVFDIYDDHQLKIASAHKEDLKGVQVADADDLEKLSDDKFALIIKTADRKVRKYPIHNEDAIKLSKAYFEHQKENMNGSIRKTAEAGFNGGQNTIEIQYVSNPIMTGMAWRNYPLHNEEHIKTAMERFPHTTQKMNPREKYAYARAIIKEAKVYNIEPEGNVLGYACDEINPLAVKIATRLRSRHIINNPDDEDLLEKVASKPTPERFIEFDKIAGFEKYVREGHIPDGYESCYSFIKVAKPEEEKIKAISATVIEQLFDPEFAKEWTKDPVVIYKSLPAPTQAMIDKQASVMDAFKKGLPVASAFLAGTASGYVAGETMAAGKAIDAQFQAKGWAKPKKRSEGFYVKDEQKVVRKSGKYMVLDKDGLPCAQADSLTKLVLMV
jgi:hypothetical protein